MASDGQFGQLAGHQVRNDTHHRGGAALVAWLIGLLGVKPTVTRMLGVAKQIVASGGPPQPEQAAELQALQPRSRQPAILVLVLAVIGAVAMSIARYV